ncbi:hypothetical protein ES703_25610 [subsurface metagenome]
MRTYPLDITVREKTLAPRAIGLKQFVPIEVTFVKQSEKDVMGDLSMISGACGGE